MTDMPVPEDPAQAERLQNVLAASKFFEAQIGQFPDVFRDLLDSGDLDRRYPATHLLDQLGELLAGCEEEADLNRLLRQVRRREMLRIVWRDFNRLAATMETTRDVSLLAEAVIITTQDWWHRHLVAQHGEPRDADGKPQQLNVIVMGKLGAHELNLSSDIDLIFAYPQTGQTDSDSRQLSNQEFFTRLGQKLINSIDQQTVDGFVFRVDMRLRPYGDSGALVLNHAAMEQYYQEQGRDWERYALIKARIISGDPDEAEALMDGLRPFVYRRYVDFSAIQSLRSMKDMINAEVQQRGMQDNVKLGPGGIREVEFIAQCFQLIRGGRSATLRNRELLWVLGALAQEGALPSEAVDELTEAYLFLRDTEHAIQGYEDQQTQMLPSSEEARRALLVAMGFDSWEAFKGELDRHRNKVAEHFSGLIAPVEGEEEGGDREEAVVWPDAIEADALAALGYSEAETVASSLVELRDSSLIHKLQAEGRVRLDGFMPKLLKVCGAHKSADMVLLRLLPMVQTLARRSAYLVLLMENPAALDELVRLSAASPWILEQLTRNPILLDELLGGGNLTAAPDRSELATALSDQLYVLPPDDLEARMDVLCHFKSAQLLRVIASEVTDSLPLMMVSDTLTYLAEVIVEQALAIAWQDITSRHGRPRREGDEPSDDDFPQGTGFAIMGYGKLGGLEMGHSSDLDMVFVYDAPPRGETDGARPLDSSVFYTRLGQRIVHIINTRTVMGQLYEVDMRLRPSGESGVLSTSLTAFEEYLGKSAWTWEHQALVRSRFVAGDPELGERCTALRSKMLCQARDEDKLRADVVEMRDKMRKQLLPPEAAPGKDRFHLKHGRGGMVDIEFLVQYLVLAWSHDHPELTTWSDNVRILETLQQIGLFSESESAALTGAYLAIRSAAHEQSLQQLSGMVDDSQFQAEREAVTACWNRLLGEGSGKCE